MKIAHYISDLLYRYDCVIIPDFGGFVTNVKSAYLNSENNTFYPPYKALSFNANLLQNDGLLANYIAKVEDCTYAEAVVKLKKTTTQWQNDLRNKTIIELDNIGSLRLNAQQKIIFEPQLSLNYLTSSYGLGAVMASERAKLLDDKVHQLNKQPRTVLKYAAIFVIGLSTIGFGNKMYQDYLVNQQIKVAQTQQKAVDNKIQSATFTITNPLPSITLEHAILKKYHIIAGAFREPENAVKKLNQLKKQGYDAAIIGKNKWDLTQVEYSSYATKAEALKSLQYIRVMVSEDAWLLVQ